MFDKFLSFFRGNISDNEGERTTALKNLPKERKGKKIKAVFANIPTFETQRLILRRIRVSDSSDMFEYSSDYEVTRYLTWYPHKTIDESREYAEYLQERYANGKFFDWGIEHKESRKFIGTCGFTSINLNNNQAEVGYVLARDYWGLGIVPEALRLIMDFGFNYLGFDKIEARFLEGNERSRKVMQKMGMGFDKIMYNSMHLKGEYKTVFTYSVSKEKFNGLYESQYNQYNNKYN